MTRTDESSSVSLFPFPLRFRPFLVFLRTDTKRPRVGSILVEDFVGKGRDFGRRVNLTELIRPQGLAVLAERVRVNPQIVGARE